MFFSIILTFQVPDVNILLGIRKKATVFDGPWYVSKTLENSLLDRFSARSKIITKNSECISKHSSKKKAVAFYFGKFYSTKVIGRGPRAAKRNLLIFFKRP